MFPTARRPSLTLLVLLFPLSCSNESGSDDDAPAPQDSETTAEDDGDDPDTDMPTDTATETSTDSDPDDMPGGDGKPRAALSLELLAGCSIDAHTVQLPAGASVSASAKGDALVQGDDNATVTCQWLGTDAPPYQINLQISDGQGTPALQAGIAFRADPAASSEGSLNLHGGDFGDATYRTSGEAPCTYEVIEADAATHSVWAKITCSTLTAQGATAEDACPVGAAFFFVENCTAP